MCLVTDLYRGINIQTIKIMNCCLSHVKEMGNASGLKAVIKYVNEKTMNIQI